MKLLRTVLYAALLLSASASIAQTRQGDVVADIPFPFVVAHQTLPAGHYIVSPANADALGIHDSHHHGTFVPTLSTQRSVKDNSCKLVFHRYGDTYFLSEVWVGGNSNGRALFRSRAERELAESGKEKVIAEVTPGK
jgi:hypothetical protein